MDAKGRISLPSRFRDVLIRSGDEKLIVTRGLGDACLDIFPLKRWEAFETRVAALPRFDANAIKLRRLYVSAATDCDIDGQGRILVPPALREHARLDKSVVWVGMGDGVELWSMPLWVEAQRQAADDMTFVRALDEELKL